MKSTGFKGIAELIQEAATREYEIILEKKLAELQVEYSKKLSLLFEQSKQEAKIKAQQLAVELLHRADLASIDIRIKL